MGRSRRGPGGPSATESSSASGSVWAGFLPESLAQGGTEERQILSVLRNIFMLNRPPPCGYYFTRKGCGPFVELSSVCGALPWRGLLPSISLGGDRDEHRYSSPVAPAVWRPVKSSVDARRDRKILLRHCRNFSGSDDQSRLPHRQRGRRGERRSGRWIREYQRKWRRRAAHQ